jgi:glucokinase
LCREWPGFEQSELVRETALDFATLIRVMETGDVIAEQILAHCLDVWAALAVSLIHAYDPEVLVMGGGIMKSADRILPVIRERVQNFAWTPWGKVRVVAAECGDQATLLGAVPLLEEFQV